jgi:hypothetical protein
MTSIFRFEMHQKSFDARALPRLSVELNALPQTPSALQWPLGGRGRNGGCKEGERREGKRREKPERELIPRHAPHHASDGSGIAAHLAAFIEELGPHTQHF